MLNSNRLNRAIYIVIITSIILALYLNNVYNYLLFHSIIEIITIAIAFAIFTLTWNTYQYSNNNSLRLLGIGFVFIAMADLLHTLVNKNIIIFSDSGENLSSQLWLVARYLQAITLFIVPLFIKHRIKNNIIIVIYTILTMSLLGLIYFDVFPTCYIDGEGLTSFKIYSEYGISVFFIASLYLFYQVRKYFNDRIFKLIAISIICMIFSEMLFATSMSVNGYSSMLGHFLKLAAFYLIYQAMLITNLKEPFDLIFSDFKETEKTVQKYYDSPAERVRELVAELRASENRYRSYIELTGQLGWVTNPTGEVEEDIPSYRRYTGQTYDEVKGNGWMKAIHPDDLIKTDRVIKQAMSIGSRFELEYRIRRYDGFYGSFITHGVPVLDQDNHIHEWVGTSIDITERKQAQEELRESEERFRSTFEQAAVGITHVAIGSGAFLRFNQRFCDIIGYTRKEILKLTYLEITNPDDINADKELHLQLLTGEISTYSLEKRYIRKDNRPVWVNLTVSLEQTLSGKPEYFITIVEDITERKRSEEKLQKTMQDLARSNSELERFAYVASHDLQEPLRMVTSYLQLLERRYKDQLDDNARDFINYAVDGSIRMKALINDLLMYSRVGTRGKEFFPTDCEIILARVLKNLEVSIQETGAEISQDPLPVIMADDTQLEQLFQNLLGNAIKFRGKNTPKIHIGVVKKENEFVFSIGDNGIGIDPQYFERIFIIFQRLHNLQDYSGTGIGLAISKRIVERHGGNIWVESRPDEGSTFYFTFPIRR